MKDQGTKPSIPNFIYSALGVLMINLIIFVLLYVIIAGICCEHDYSALYNSGHALFG